MRDVFTDFVDLQVVKLAIFIKALLGGSLDQPFSKVLRKDIAILLTLIHLLRDEQVIGDLRMADY